VAALLVLTPGPASAQDVTPRCPATVGDLPLSATAPFSGTTRPVAGDDGEIASTSLLCAYGDGVQPSAEVTVSWATGAGCADTETLVAPTLDEAPFEAAAADLTDELGGACPPSEAGGLPVLALAAGGAGVVTLAGLVIVGRRPRRPARVPVVAPAPAPILDRRPHPEPEPVVGATLPGPTPVLATLTGSSGRAFARTSAGQWAAVSAVAYVHGNSVAGDLARAGALQVLASKRPARAEVTAVATALAHPSPGGDR
jgi:hypothetical protein